jgi:hypothetical protein
MKTIGQIITTPLCDCSGVKQLKFREEKNKFIVQGEDFCKVYEKIKGVDFSLCETTNHVAVTFDVNQIEAFNKYGKFIELIKLVKEYNEHTNEKTFWKKLQVGAETVSNIQDVLNLEKQISYKTHIVSKNVHVELGSNFLCTIVDNEIKIFKKNNRNQLHRKTVCGFVYDCDNTFLNNFNDSIKENETVTKNIIITDVLPKLKNKPKFSFKNTQSLSAQTKLANSRVIVYYPTEYVIEKILFLVNEDVNKPKVLWIVLPHNPHILPHFQSMINILFWSKIDIISKNGLNLTCVLYGDSKCGNPRPTKNTNNIIIEKIVYKLNKLEESILENVDDKYIYILDKLFFSSYGSKLPEQIFDTSNCPVCDNEFNDLCNKSYLSCGHEFCTSCIIELANNKLTCPICRKNIKYNGIIIPNLIPNKAKYLSKIFNKVFTEDNENDDNILIYVDTAMMAKGLFMFIDTELYPKNSRLKCCIVNQKNNNYKSCILICVKDKNFICQNIKNIKYVIVLTSVSDYILNPESLGYDYCYADQKIRILIFENQIRSNNI